MAAVLLFRSPAVSPAEDEYHKVRNSFRGKKYWCTSEGIKQYAYDNQNIILKHESVLKVDHDKLTSAGPRSQGRGNCQNYAT